MDKEGNRLVASHKKAIVDSTMVDLSVGAVVKGELPHCTGGRGGRGGRGSVRGGGWEISTRSGAACTCHPRSLAMGRP